jgi:hypothetical protein
MHQALDRGRIAGTRRVEKLEIELAGIDRLLRRRRGAARECEQECARYLTGGERQRPGQFSGPPVNTSL